MREIGVYVAVGSLRNAKYRVIARRPFGADVAISRYNEAIRNAGMSRASTKMYLCLQHFRQRRFYQEIATSLRSSQ